jgi:hypothetical protein
VNCHDDVHPGRRVDELNDLFVAVILGCHASSPPHKNNEIGAKLAVSLAA